MTRRTAMPTIIPDRLERITGITLGHGNHEPPNGHFAACAMETASYLAGEPWSDQPECVCPVIATFMRSWNDGISDAARRTELLLPLVPLTIGTRASKAVEARRATMAADWYVRVHTTAWLRLAGLTSHADKLAALPEITSFAETQSVRVALQAAQKDATAARNAAKSAARNAAWSAAERAAVSAARNAAVSADRSAAERAAWSAAESAAWIAARNAAWSAAESVTESTLSATATDLQTSAVDLVRRMCAVSEDAP